MHECNSIQAVDTYSSNTYTKSSRKYGLGHIY